MLGASLAVAALGSTAAAASRRFGGIAALGAAAVVALSALAPGRVRDAKSGGSRG
jgi:hypothetical protein